MLPNFFQIGYNWLQIRLMMKPDVKSGRQNHHNYFLRTGTKVSISSIIYRDKYYGDIIFGSSSS